MKTNSEKKGLTEGAKLFAQDWISSYPDEKELEGIYRYSQKHQKRMARMATHHDKIFYSLTRNTKHAVAAAVVALFITGNIFVLLNTEAMAVVSGFFVTRYEEFSDIFFPTDNSTPQTILEIYEPGYLPSGFEIVSTDVMNAFYMVEYVNDSEKHIDFIQGTLGGGSTLIDTEDADVEYVTINGHEAMLVYKHSYDIYSIIWSNDQYSFYITGTSSRDDIIKMAESVEVLP